jgi:hypothetical protein
MTFDGTVWRTVEVNALRNRILTIRDAVKQAENTPNQNLLGKAQEELQG